MISTEEKKMLDQETRAMRKQVALDAAAMSYGSAGCPTDEALIARAQKLYDWLTPTDIEAHMKVVGIKRNRG